MRGRVARNAFAIGTAGLVVLGMAGCQQSEPSSGGGGGGEAQSDLKIVEQVPIDENGKEIKPPDATAAADPPSGPAATVA